MFGKEGLIMELKGSKTEANLMTAFAGESQARNKYTYFASKARKDGYEQIAEIFEETANNEKEHAKMWFKELNGGTIPSTIDNLLAAAEGENYETSTLKKISTEYAILKFDYPSTGAFFEVEAKTNKLPYIIVTTILLGIGLFYCLKCKKII